MHKYLDLKVPEILNTRLGITSRPFFVFYQLLVILGSQKLFTIQIILCSTWQRVAAFLVPRGYLQNDVIEPDEVLRPGRALAVIFRLLLQQSPVQAFSHALVPPDCCGQLDVGQVAATYHTAAQVTLEEAHALERILR